MIFWLANSIQEPLFPIIFCSWTSVFLFVGTSYWTCIGNLVRSRWSNYLCKWNFSDFLCKLNSFYGARVFIKDLGRVWETSKTCESLEVRHISSFYHFFVASLNNQELSLILWIHFIRWLLCHSKNDENIRCTSWLLSPWAEIWLLLYMQESSNDCELQ